MEFRKDRIWSLILSIDFLLSLLTFGLTLFLWNRYLDWSFHILIGPLTLIIGNLAITIFTYLWTYTNTDINFKIFCSNESEKLSHYSFYMIYAEFFFLFIWQFVLGRYQEIMLYASEIIMLIFNIIHFGISIWMIITLGKKIMIGSDYIDDKEEHSDTLWNVSLKSHSNKVLLLIIFSNLICFFLITFFGIISSYQIKDFLIIPSQIRLPNFQYSIESINWTYLWYIQLGIYLISIITILVIKQKYFTKIHSNELIPKILKVSNFSESQIISILNSEIPEKNQS